MDLFSPPLDSIFSKILQYKFPSTAVLLYQERERVTNGRVSKTAALFHAECAPSPKVAPTYHLFTAESHSNSSYTHSCGRNTTWLKAQTRNRKSMKVLVCMLWLTCCRRLGWNWANCGRVLCEFRRVERKGKSRGKELIGPLFLLFFLFLEWRVHHCWLIKGTRVPGERRPLVWKTLWNWRIRWKRIEAFLFSFFYIKNEVNNALQQKLITPRVAWRFLIVAPLFTCAAREPLCGAFLPLGSHAGGSDCPLIFIWWSKLHQRERERETLNAKQANLWHFKRNPRASAGVGGARKRRGGGSGRLLGVHSARRAQTGGTLINQTAHVEGGGCVGGGGDSLGRIARRYVNHYTDWEFRRSGTPLPPQQATVSMPPLWRWLVVADAVIWVDA